MVALVIFRFLTIGILLRSFNGITFNPAFTYTFKYDLIGVDTLRSPLFQAR